MTLGIGPLRHRRQAERDLFDAVQFPGELQALVVVGSDREQRDDRGRVFGQQIAQQSEKSPSLILSLGQKQLLALIDGEDQGCRPGRCRGVDN
jgi:hypothetical protein